MLVGVAALVNGQGVFLSFPEENLCESSEYNEFSLSSVLSHTIFINKWSPLEHPAKLSLNSLSGSNLSSTSLFVTGPRGWNYNGHNYFFSEDITGDPDFYNGTTPLKYNWLEARNVCRKRCMDAVGMESEGENDMIFNFVQSRECWWWRC